MQSGNPQAISMPAGQGATDRLPNDTAASRPHAERASDASPHAGRSAVDVVSAEPAPAFTHALCEALIRSYPDGDASTAKPEIAAAAAFLDAQRRGMPHLLPHAMWLATLAMELSTLPRHRRRFSALDLDTRRRVVAAWRHSRLGPIATFLKFHEVFASYILYSSSGEGRLT